MKIILLALLTVSCSVKPKLDPCASKITPSFNIKRTSLPVLTYISTNIPNELRSAIYRAAETINKSVGKNLVQLTETTYTRNYIEIMPIFDGTKDQEAYTHIRSADGGIIDASIRVNNKYPYYNNRSKPGAINFEALILHELGHFLGLPHSEDIESAMYPELGANEDRIILTEDDITTLKCKYNIED